MMVFRIAQSKYSDTLDGFGAFLHGGRWTPKGLRAVYTAASRSLAYLEFLVHQIEKPYWTKDLKISSIQIDDHLIKSIQLNTLPTNWNEVEYPSVLQTVGEREFQSGALGIKVPSVIVKEEFNIILNPQHHAFRQKVSLEKIESLEIDKRFYGQG